MANAFDMKNKTPGRIMIVGYPGSAKTGCIACLANAGFKIRMLDFDGNYEPLLRFCTDEGLRNIDIFSCEDKLRQGARYHEVIGQPQAFANAWKMLDRWKYKNPDGTETDLGASKEWGPDHIVLLDSLTSMGKASFRRAQFLKNKTPENNTDAVWGFAMAEQDAMIEQLTSVSNHFHVIVLAHLKMIGPKSPRREKGEEEDVTAMKIKIAADAAQLIPTRLFPSALGQQLPPEIGGHFPTLILAESVPLGNNKVVRRLKTIPRPELDLKVPSPNIPAEMDVKDGMLQVFKALGYATPNGTTTPAPVEAVPVVDDGVSIPEAASRNTKE